MTCKTNTYGSKFWYKNGKLHREDNPAIEYVSGGKKWYKYGERHRTDGPAVEYANGDKFWYQNDVRHRTDGPAVEFANNNIEWWIDGIKLTRNEFAAKLDDETAMLWKMSGYHRPFDFGLDK
jgi:hypothetical protein